MRGREEQVITNTQSNLQDLQKRATTDWRGVIQSLPPSLQGEAEGILHYHEAGFKLAYELCECSPEEASLWTNLEREEARLERLLSWLVSGSKPETAHQFRKCWRTFVLQH